MPKHDDINIELLYPHDLFIKAEELFEKKAVEEISRIEKGLYNFTVKDGGKMEVEWLKPLTRYQKATCNCNFFKENKVCRHIIAALIAYKDSVKKTTRETPITEKNSSLTINNILNGVSKEEIKNFIKAYARYDKKFLTALKVQFARKVDLLDNEKKYKSLLDAVIKPVTQDKAGMKVSEVRSFINIIDDFYHQAQDSMALSEWGEAFYLSKVSLNKLCYVYHYSDHYKMELEKVIAQFHGLIAQLIADCKSTELLEQIETYLHDLAALSYYPYLDLNANAVAILTRWKKLPDDVIDILQRQIERKKEDESQVVVVLAFHVLVLSYKGKEAELAHKFQTYYAKVAAALYQAEWYEVARLFCQGNLKSGGDLILYYLRSLHALGSKKLVTEAAACFIQFHELNVVDYAMAHFDADAKEKFRHIVNTKNNKKSLPESRQYYFFAKTGQLDALLSALAEKNDIRTLMTYDHYLIPSLENKLAELYEVLIEKYLNSYLGNHSQVFLAEVFDHLSKIKAQKVSKKLGLMLDMKFSHRIGLEDLYKVQH